MTRQRQHDITQYKTRRAQDNAKAKTNKTTQDKDNTRDKGNTRQNLRD